MSKTWTTTARSSVVPWRRASRKLNGAGCAWTGAAIASSATTARANPQDFTADNGNVPPESSLMPIIRVSTTEDPRLAEYRELVEPARTRARGLFVAEGRLVVRRLLEGQRFRVHSLLVSEAARAGLEDLLPGLEATAPVFVCPVEWFEPITGFNLHRGCLALAVRPPVACWEDVARAAHSLVVLDGVGNADNVGGVFRNAAAFGVDGVLLSPSCGDPFYRKSIRTSMGAVLRVPHAVAGDWPASVDRLRTLGFTVAALTPRQPSEPIYEWTKGSIPSRWALVVGAEGPGLSEAVEASADRRLRIPITAEVDSLNVAVATGIALSVLSVRSTNVR